MATTLQVPVVDLSGIEFENERAKIVDEIREASAEWGIFQVINHGIPSCVLEEMIEGIRKFHELDVELKKEYYSSDQTRRVIYEKNVSTAYQLDTEGTGNWRDTLYMSRLLCGHIEPEEIPAVCRKTCLEYINHVIKLGETLFGILSEALGLKINHLGDMDCAKGQSFTCHYYPPCPQPEATLGLNKHTDPAFLAILLQDLTGGLQVMHDNRWVDVEPIERGLIVNIGDFLQILSNDKFLSPPHRVVANKVGSRISVGCFFNGLLTVPKMYGPIKELISEENPAVYKEFLPIEYLSKFKSAPNKLRVDLYKM